MATTTWISQTPGAVVTESLLTQVQNEAAAAELSAIASAASASASDVSASAAAASAIAAAASASAASTSAANALTYANQALTAAGSLTPIPAGGTTGQSLVKNSATNYDYAWATVSGGGGSLAFQDEGSLVLASPSNVNFVGSGVTVTDVAGVATVTIPGASGAVSSVFGRTGAVVAATNDYTFAQIGSKPTTLSGYGITDAAALSHVHAATDITSGTLPDARFPATLPALSGANLTALNATNIASGTLAAARLPATAALTSGTLAQFAATTSAQLLGVISDETGTGALVFATSPTLVTPVLGTPASGNLSNCTALNATQLTAGTVPDARFPATLPALSGVNLTALNGSNIASGTVDPARLGSGTSITTKYLRGDSTWQTISGGGDALTSGNLSQFAATTSAQLAGVISDETGTGALVFGTNPTLTGATLAGAVVGAAQEVRDVVHRDTAYYRSAPTISAGALTLDYEAGPFFSVALNAAITSLTLSNPPASGTVGVMTIRFTADGTLRAITWPASVRWGTAGAPTMTSTNNKVDYVQLITVDGGTTWDAFTNGQSF